MILLLKLSKKLIILTLMICFSTQVFSEPKDIWKQSKEIIINEEQKKENQNLIQNINKDLPQTIFDKEKLNFSINQISQSSEINDQEVIFGLYEPEETKINLNF